MAGLVAVIADGLVSVSTSPSASFLLGAVPLAVTRLVAVEAEETFPASVFLLFGTVLLHVACLVADETCGTSLRHVWIAYSGNGSTSNA